jgi:hypothetical protein
VKAFKVFGAIIGMCVSMPLWYILVYKILATIHATDGMWTMYWIYLPAGILMTIILRICEAVGSSGKK